jgi:hypothetical protein
METPPKLKTNVEVLAKAIRRRAVVSFTYQDKEQIVAEPTILGVHKDTGKHVLRCYKSFPLHIGDKKDNWLLLDVDDMTNLKITPMRSKDLRKHGMERETEMSEIIENIADYMRD